MNAGRAGLNRVRKNPSGLSSFVACGTVPSPLYKRRLYTSGGGFLTFRIEGGDFGLVQAPAQSAGVFRAWRAFLAPGDGHRTLAMTQFNATWRGDLPPWASPISRRS